jgi:formylglycine-generating enzyme required for sulfatase activity
MKNLNLFYVFLVALLFINASPCFGIISGTVTDAFKNPVAGASVIFTDESDSTRFWSATTDKNGEYQIAITSSVRENSLPQSFLLKQNYPNPFNPTTIIPFTLSKPENCILSIYNIQGQKVRTLIDGYFSTGEHSAIWNGLDEMNRPASAGIYFYRLQVGGKSETKKMLLLDGGASGNYRSVSSLSKLEKSGKITATTYQVTISSNDIVQYKENGLVINNAGTYDFTVIRINQYQGITFVSIPGGTFQMGDEKGDLNSDCLPVHTVTVSSFQMSETEITNAQYCEYLNAALKSGDIMSTSSSVTGAKGSYSGQVYVNLYVMGNMTFSNNVFSAHSGVENWPVDSVTWYGSKAFAEYYGYDLPCEAEWEYACRGRKQYLYGTDDGTISKDKANYYWGNGSVGHPVNVKSYPKNPVGLYDMSGNVWEWCNDWYSSYSSLPSTNPTGMQSGSYRVVRGGYWDLNEFGSRSAERYYYNPNRFLGMGFRVVRR